MRVVVTGASGFIGKLLTEKLSKLGHDVLAFVRTVPESFSSSRISWLKVDLSSPDTYIDEIKLFNPEVVIHLAWQDIPDFSLEKSKINLDQSSEFIKHVAALKSCKKILVSGSCLEYDKTIGNCEESEIINSSKNHFTWAKNILRKRTEIICKNNYICFAWFRIFYVYGPGQRVGSLLPMILSSLYQGELPKINSPYNSNDYIFIDDVIELFAIATTINFSSGIYNIGSGISTSALEICRRAEKILLNSSKLSNRIQNDSLPNKLDQNFWADISQTFENFNWSPKTNLNEGIKLTIRDLDF